jgi:hypothetical protein
MYMFLPIKIYNTLTGLRVGIVSTVFPFRNLQEPERSWNTISESLEEICCSVNRLMRVI